MRALRTEWRRRAVVCGVATDDDGTPWRHADRLALHACDLEAEAAPRRGRARFACHLRRGGHFYFLDVPPGRYELRRTNDSGVPVQVDAVDVEAYGRDDKVPIVRMAYRVGPDRPGPVASAPLR